MTGQGRFGAEATGSSRYLAPKEPDKQIVKKPLSKIHKRRLFANLLMIFGFRTFAWGDGGKSSVSEGPCAPCRGEAL